MSNDNTTPSHSEETETTAEKTINTPVKWEVVLGSANLIDSKGYSLAALGRMDIPERNFIVTAVNSYHQLQSDNEAKEKRIEQLEIALKVASTKVYAIRETLGASNCSGEDIQFSFEVAGQIRNDISTALTQ